MATESNDSQAEPVLARVIVLLDKASLLERGEQPGRGRLVEAEASCELGDPCLPLCLPESDQERRSAVD
jgi:hypothetical protein